MSQINVDAIRASNGTGDAISLTASDKTCTANITNIPGRNLLMNGAMQVAQRADLTTAADGYGAVDRWYFYNEGDGRATITQSTDVPSTKEFKYSYKLDVTTADTAGAGSRGHVGQWLEARDSGVTLKGTSAAKQITVQFWVKSPKTGTHIVALSDNGATDHSSSRFINATYTVSTANTWEKKTVTFAGDTTGVFNTTTGRGFHVGFRLVQGSNSTSGALATSWADYALANEGAGQVNVLDNTSNDFYLTGVQMELGDYATDFEHKSYCDELSKCQRYYYQLVPPGGVNTPIGIGVMYTTGIAIGIVDFPTTMRTNPSMVAVTGSDYFRVVTNSTNDGCDHVQTEDVGNTCCGFRLTTNLSVGSNGMAFYARTMHASAAIGFNADL